MYRIFQNKVNQLIVQIGSEIFQRMTGRDGPKLAGREAVLEINGLREYVNGLYLNISKGWGLTVPKLSDTNRRERQKYKGAARAKKGAAAAAAESGSEAEEE